MEPTTDEQKASVCDLICKTRGSVIARHVCDHHIHLGTTLQIQAAVSSVYTIASTARMRQMLAEFDSRSNSGPMTFFLFPVSLPVRVVALPDSRPFPAPATMAKRKSLCVFSEHGYNSFFDHVDGIEISNMHRHVMSNYIVLEKEADELESRRWKKMKYSTTLNPLSLPIYQFVQITTGSNDQTIISVYPSLATPTLPGQWRAATGAWLVVINCAELSLDVRQDMQEGLPVDARRTSKSINAGVRSAPTPRHAFTENVRPFQKKLQSL
ncbi:hypothetical protein CBL_05532 [Carabus blaptoides fortunei]